MTPLQILSFFDSIRNTQENVARQQPLRIDVRLVHTDLPLPISTEPAKPRRACIRNSVELARYGYTTGRIGCEAAMTQEPSLDYTEQCRTRIIQAMSSDVAFSARIWDAHERMSRPFSDAEPNMKKVRFAEHTTEPVSSAVSTFLSLNDCVSTLSDV